LVGELELRTSWESFWWLLTLALTSQVLGWLPAALPRAPAALSSIVLTLQPVAAVFLAIVLVDEDASPVQLAGVAVVVCGIVLATGQARLCQLDITPVLVRRPEQRRCIGFTRSSSRNRWRGRRRQRNLLTAESRSFGNRHRVGKVVAVLDLKPMVWGREAEG